MGQARLDLPQHCRREIGPSRSFSFGLRFLFVLCGLFGALFLRRFGSFLLLAFGLGAFGFCFGRLLAAFGRGLFGHFLLGSAGNEAGLGLGELEFFSLEILSSAAGILDFLSGG